MEKKLEQMFTVLRFDSDEAHKAENLVDYLLLYDIDPVIFDGQEDDDSLIVAVPREQFEQAAILAQNFSENYSDVIELIVDATYDKSRAGFWFVAWIPILLIVIGVWGIHNEFGQHGSSIQMAVAFLLTFLGISVFILLNKHRLR